MLGTKQAVDTIASCFEHKHCTHEYKTYTHNYVDQSVHTIYVACFVTIFQCMKYAHSYSEIVNKYQYITLHTNIIVYFTCIVCLFVYWVYPVSIKANSGFSANTNTVQSFIYKYIRHVIRKLQSIVCNPKTTKSVRKI